MAYNIFPNNIQDIGVLLKTFPEHNIIEIINLFTYLRGKEPSILNPINIDITKKTIINISRQFQLDYDIKTINNALKLKILKIKFGNGSSGNRGSNNRGNLFESVFAGSLTDWYAGEKVADNLMIPINDLNKEYQLSSTKNMIINMDGSNNTKRPLKLISNKFIISNPGSGFNIGKSIADITLVNGKEEVYLSLKLGGITTFFNVGVKTYFPTTAIKKDSIPPDGLKLLWLFGIDPKLFVDVFNSNLKAGVIDKSPKINKQDLEILLQSGIGYGYHIIHKLSSGIISKKMNEISMIKASKIISPLTIYYGGKSGKGKRIDIEFESTVYKFKINIRDTQGKDGYPTRMMCEFTPK